MPDSPTPTPEPETDYAAWRFEEPEIPISRSPQMFGGSLDVPEWGIGEAMRGGLPHIIPVMNAILVSLMMVLTVGIAIGILVMVAVDFLAAARLGMLAGIVGALIGIAGGVIAACSFYGLAMDLVLHNVRGQTADFRRQWRNRSPARMRTPLRGESDTKYFFRAAVIPAVSLGVVPAFIAAMWNFTTYSVLLGAFDLALLPVVVAVPLLALAVWRGFWPLVKLDMPESTIAERLAAMDAIARAAGWRLALLHLIFGALVIGLPVGADLFGWLITGGSPLPTAVVIAAYVAAWPLTAWWLGSFVWAYARMSPAITREQFAQAVMASASATATESAPLTPMPSPAESPSPESPK